MLNKPSINRHDWNYEGEDSYIQSLKSEDNENIEKINQKRVLKKITGFKEENQNKNNENFKMSNFNLNNNSKSKEYISHVYISPEDLTFENFHDCSELKSTPFKSTFVDSSQINLFGFKNFSNKSEFLTPIAFSKKNQEEEKQSEI